MRIFLADTPAELKQFFLEQGAAYMYPREIHVIREMPLTSAKKVDRIALKELAVRRKAKPAAIPTTAETTRLACTAGSRVLSKPAPSAVRASRSPRSKREISITIPTASETLIAPRLRSRSARPPAPTP